MRFAAAALTLLLAAAPALAQTAPGDAPQGKPTPAEHQGEGEQSATSGSRMVKDGDKGAPSPAGAEAPAKP